MNANKKSKYVPKSVLESPQIFHKGINLNDRDVIDAGYVDIDPANIIYVGDVEFEDGIGSVELEDGVTISAGTDYSLYIKDQFQIMEKANEANGKVIISDSSTGLDIATYDNGVITFTIHGLTGIMGIKLFSISEEDYHKMDEKFIPELGSGLPEAGVDGTALIYINGEWKPVEGYGYSEELELAMMDVPEGYEDYIKYVRVSDLANLPDNFGEGSAVTYWLFDGTEDNTLYSLVNYASGNVFSHIEESEPIPWFFVVTEDNSSITFLDNLFTANFAHKGIYFAIIGGDMYTSGFAFGAATEKLVSWDGNTGGVHPIDPKFIPMSDIQSMIDASIGNAIGGEY